MGGEKMRKFFAVATVALVLPLSLQAADGPAKKTVKEEKKKEKETSERGSGFTHFWVHTVGGSIGNGLKSGARKIEKTFD
jgi:hypothetical protein